MSNREDSTGKTFFSTLPGIITAIAGLVTAVGGFILILSKAGCLSRKTSSHNSGQVVKGSANNDDTSHHTGNSEASAGQNVSYTPTESKLF